MLSVGVPLDVVWDCTPATALSVYKAYIDRVYDEVDKTEILAWKVGYNVALGFHSPKKYPQKPNLVSRDDDNDEPALSYEEQVARLFGEVPD
jgi:hypothetical protein